MGGYLHSRVICIWRTTCGSMLLHESFIFLPFSISGVLSRSSLYRFYFFATDILIDSVDDSIGGGFVFLTCASGGNFFICSGDQQNPEEGSPFVL